MQARITRTQTKPRASQMSLPSVEWLELMLRLYVYKALSARRREDQSEPERLDEEQAQPLKRVYGEEAQGSPPRAMEGSKGQEFGAAKKLLKGKK